MLVRATSSVTAHDHPPGMARKLDLHLLEDPKATAALIAKILGIGTMDERQTAWVVLVVTRRKWMWISRKTPMRMRWKR